MKIRTVEAELFDADRWTDMVVIIVASYKFVNMPKKCSIWST